MVARSYGRDDGAAAFMTIKAFIKVTAQMKSMTAQIESMA
jgi:hypothetical protein